MSSIVTGLLISTRVIVALLPFHEKLCSNNNAARVFSYNSRTDDVHFRNTASHSFFPISPGLLLLRLDFNAAGAAGAGESGDDRPERREPHFLDCQCVERRIGHACVHDGSASPQGNAEAGSLVL